MADNMRDMFPSSIAAHGLSSMLLLRTEHRIPEHYVRYLLPSGQEQAAQCIENCSSFLFPKQCRSTKMSHILLLVASVLITATSAQTLTEVLQSQSDLSSWLQLIKPYWNDLDSLTNITFFAPSNDAVTNYFNTPQISGCASTDVAVLKALTVSSISLCCMASLR